MLYNVSKNGTFSVAISNVYRKGLSAVTQHGEMVHDFANEVKHRNQIDIMFLDFSITFDHVSHPKVIVKYHNFNKKDQITTRFRNYETGKPVLKLNPPTR